MRRIKIKDDEQRSPEDGHARQPQNNNPILRQAPATFVGAGQDDKTNTLEVHHPHHPTHKKKWTEYVLEFFMLFLAVFLGFLVENYREHKTEQERTEKHMHTLVENLKYDTTRYGTNLRRNVVTAKGLDSFRHEIKEAMAGTANTNKLYYYYWKYAQGLNIPIINDAAISELKSSGLLPMVKSDSLVNEMGDYYGRRVTTLNRSLEAITRSKASLLETAKQVFSYREFDELAEKETMFSVIPNKQDEVYFAAILTRVPALQLLPSATANYERLYTDLSIYQTALRNFNSFIRYCHQGADSLMKQIKDEYDFE